MKKIITLIVGIVGICGFFAIMAIAEFLTKILHTLPDIFTLGILVLIPTILITYVFYKLEN